MRSREEIQAILTLELDRAMDAFHSSVAELQLVGADESSETRQAAEGTQVKLAGDAKARAAAALRTALQRHNEFVLNGKIPEDLR